MLLNTLTVNVDTNAQSCKIFDEQHAAFPFFAYEGDNCDILLEMCTFRRTPESDVSHPFLRCDIA
eukprot:Awhi_evm1s6873